MKPPVVMLNSAFPSIASQKRPFEGREDLSHGYHLFAMLAIQRGLPMLFASADDFDFATRTIAGHWGFDAFHGWHPIAERWSVDAVFDKIGDLDERSVRLIDSLIAQGVPIFGHVGLQRWTSDKWLSYGSFQEFFALTRKLEPGADTIMAQLEHFFGVLDHHYTDHENRCVLKPVRGYESRGIHLAHREDSGIRFTHLWGQPIDEPEHVRGVLDYLGSTPFLAQAFVNTSQGIPELGLQTPWHDARFTFVIEAPGRPRFVDNFVKTPYGMIYVPADAFPDEALAFVEPIAWRVAEMFPYGMFCVDCMRDVSGQWFITEFNSQMGFNVDITKPEDLAGVSGMMHVFIDELLLIREHPDDPRYSLAWDEHTAEEG